MTGEVSPLGGGDDVASPGDLRASHQDRDQVVELLRVAAGDGRLTAEELDERLEEALTARTYAELAAVTRDLPATPGFVTGAPATKPKELVRIDCHGSSTKRDGRWLVPQRIEAKVTGGNVTLDFTDAVIFQPSLLIDADLRGGSLTLVTKPGIVVDTDDIAVRGSNIKVQAPWGPGAPVVLRIHVSGRVSGGNIVARPPRRTFWQWLRRRPRPGPLALPRG